MPTLIGSGCKGEKNYLAGEDVNFDLGGDHAPNLVVFQVVSGAVAPAMSNEVSAPVFWRSVGTWEFYLHVRRSERYSLSVAFSDDIDPGGVGIPHFRPHLVHS